MAKYRLTKGSHSAYVGGKHVTYQAGVEGKDELELTDDQAKLPHLRKRIEKYYGPEVQSASAVQVASAPLDLKPDDDDDTSDDSDIDPKLAGVLAGNVDQVLAYINDHADDIETLEALREGETAGKGRKGVLDAIDNLLETEE